MSGRSSTEAHRERPSAAPWVGLGVLVVAAAILWSLFREPEMARPKPASTPREAPAAAATTAPAPVASTELAEDGIAIMAAGPSDHSADDPRHPHPVTPTHLRNFRQLNMVAVLNGAMDVGDVDELRRVNRQYREEYPEATLLQDGYDIIANCIQERTQATREAAERYWETAIASNLRRYVRRHCLE
jgi:hypothetical protein